MFWKQIVERPCKHGSVYRGSHTTARIFDNDINGDDGDDDKDGNDDDDGDDEQFDDYQDEGGCSMLIVFHLTHFPWSCTHSL